MATTPRFFFRRGAWSLQLGRVRIQGCLPWVSEGAFGRGYNLLPSLSIIVDFKREWGR